MAELEQVVGLDIAQALSDADNLAESAGLALDAALTAAIEGLSAQFVSVSDEIQSRLADAFSAEQTVPVTADTTPAEGAVAAFVSDAESKPTTIDVDADTSDAQSAIDDLTDSSSDAAVSLGSAKSEASGLADSVGLAAGGAALARGEIGGLSEAAGALTFTSTAALAGVGALGASVGFLFEKGLDATSALQRFDFIVGDMADQVLNVKVGDLNEDLDKLAIKLGTDDEALRSASATLFQFAINSGASREEAALFTNQVDALAARAVALNPALGGVDTAAETLSVRLARGGRFASAFGLSLTAAEINARALANTQKTAATDLTIYEKSQAAAQIAVEKYGNTLNDTVVKGSKNAAIEQRSLKEQLNNVFEAAGKPLVSPILDLFKESQPGVAALGQSVGDLAEASIPAVKGALDAVIPVLQIASTVIGGLTELTDAFGVSSIAAGAGIGFLVGGPIGALIGAGAGLLSLTGAFGDNLQTDKERVDALARSLKDLPPADAAARFERYLDRLGVGAKQADFFDFSLGNVNEGFKEFTRLARADIGVAQVVVEGLQQRGIDTARYRVILNQVAGAQKTATAATKEAAAAETLLTGAYSDQIKILDEKSDALLASYDATFRAFHADEQARDALDKLNTAYDESIKAGNSQTKALDDESRALTSAEESILHAAAATGAKAESDHEAEGAVVAHKAGIDAQIIELHKFSDTLAPGSPLKIFLEDYITKLNDPAVNGVHTATVRVDNTQALLGIEDVAAALRGIGVDVGGLVIPPPATAAGGGDFYGAAATAGTFVGEAGTEFVRGRPGGGFTVYSNPQVRAGAASSATPNVELNVDVRVDSRGIATTTITDTQGNTLAVKKQQVRADVRAL